jgi:hypothetical protein
MNEIQNAALLNPLKYKTETLRSCLRLYVLILENIFHVKEKDMKLINSKGKKLVKEDSRLLHICLKRNYYLSGF